MTAGVLALLAAATALGHDPLRQQLATQIPAVWNALQPQPVQEGGGASMNAVAEVEGLPVAQTSVLEVLTQREQKLVTQYLARRYRVADEAVRKLVAAAYHSGAELRLDPQLILAVMAIESGMNPLAESAMGAQGLMQVMTRVHGDKFEPHGGGEAALDPIANIKVGSVILKELVQRGGSVERGLQLYVGAGNLADDGGYVQRIVNEKNRIVLAAGGQLDAALRTAPRSAPPAQAESTPTVAPAPMTVKPDRDA
jgi:soluble lytic murein transglycosylase-like protein